MDTSLENTDEGQITKNLENFNEIFDIRNTPKIGAAFLSQIVSENREQETYSI